MTSSVLSSRLWPQSGLLRNVVLAVLGSLIVTAAAQVQVPMYPVPMTLQTLAVLMLGAAYGPRLGGATLALYALQGSLGLPVWPGFDSGVWYPSYGFIPGFIAAAVVVGWLAERGWDRTPLRMFGAMLAGNVVLYIPGLIWLAVWLGAGLIPGAGIEKTFEWGMTPFVLGDLLKAAIAALVFPAIWALLDRR